MEIKENEFVRTDNGIFEVTKIDGLYIYLDKQYFDNQYQTMRDVTFKERIVNHSFNIIDLIEVGDIIEINKEKYEVIYDESLDKLGVLIPNRDCLGIRHSALEHIFMKYEDITILTKEQYQSNCYTVEVE